MVIFSKFNKVINGEIGESTKIMTAGINSMGVEAEHLSDVLVRAGAVSATDAQTIGQIIQKAGGMAKQGGIELEKLASMGATISEKTQEEGTVIGDSLKIATIYSNAYCKPREIRESLFWLKIILSQVKSGSTTIESYISKNILIKNKV